MLINCWCPIASNVQAYKYEPVETFYSRAFVAMDVYENPDRRATIIEDLFRRLAPGYEYMAKSQIDDLQLTPFFSKQVLEDPDKMMVEVTLNMVLCRLRFKKGMEYDPG